MVMGNLVFAVWLWLGYPVPEYMQPIEPTRSYLPRVPTRDQSE